MRRRTLVQITCSVLVIGSLAAMSAQTVRDGFAGAWGALFSATPSAPQQSVARLQAKRARPASDALERLHHWNSIAIDASGLDHTPVSEGDERHFGEQLGPGRATARWIVHLAIYEAVNAIAGSHESMIGMGGASRGASVDAAIAQAAYDTLVALFPSQTTIMDGYMADEMESMDTAGRVQGLHIGRKPARRGR